jgi:hypothetical protein
MSAMLSAMIASLNLNDKVALNQILAASIAEEMGVSSASAGVGSPIKAGPGRPKKEKDPNAPKRKAAPGVLAWNAFVKHCKAVEPQLFEGVKLEKDRLAICGGIKLRDTAAYESFVADFIKALPPSGASSVTESDAEEAVTAPPPKAKGAKKEKTPEEKAAASQKRKEAAAKKKAASGSAPQPAAVAIPATVAVSEESDMQKKTIKGKNYLMDPSSKNLYITDGKFESVGDFVGKFCPGNDAAPIDFTAEE